MENGCARSTGNGSVGDRFPSGGSSSRRFGGSGRSPAAPWLGRSDRSMSLLVVKDQYFGAVLSAMAKTVTVSSKGQITLPEALRKKCHLREGEKALVLASGDGVLIKHGRASLRGILKGRVDASRLEKDIKGLRRWWRL